MTRSRFLSDFLPNLLVVIFLSGFCTLAGIRELSKPEAAAWGIERFCGYLFFVLILVAVVTFWHFFVKKEFVRGGDDVQKAP